MSDDFYTSGAETALEDLHLEKVAILGVLGTLGRAGLSAGKSLWKSTGGKGLEAYGKHVSKPLTAKGQVAEKWIGQKATQYGGKGTGRVVKNLVKGVPGEVLRQGAGGAAIGGVGGGVMGAVNAEPGDRLSGALSGAASGAASWGAMGAGAGLAGGTVRNLGRMGVGQIAKSKGLRGNAKEVGQVLKPGPGNWSQNIKDIKSGQGALGRGGSLAAAATGTAALGADLYATTKIDEALQGRPKSPQQQGPPGPPQAIDRYTQARPPYRMVTAGIEPVNLEPPTEPPKEKSSIPTGIIGSALGGTISGLGAAAAMQVLKAKKILPVNSFTEVATQAIPSIAGTVGSLAGYTAGQKLDTEALIHAKKLRAIDLDKLMRYYKKPPEVVQPAPAL